MPRASSTTKTPPPDTKAVVVRPSSRPANGKLIEYDEDRHCGAITSALGDPVVHCIALKGLGTKHPEVGYCSDHEHLANHYSSIRNNRLANIIQRVRNGGSDPSDIISELEVLRALTIQFLEENADLDDREDLMMASDLLDKVMKAAVTYRKMRQEEMLHIKIVELIHMNMAEVLMREVEKIDPATADDWRGMLVDRIRNGWGTIKVETNLKAARELIEQGRGEEE